MTIRKAEGVTIGRVGKRRQVVIPKKVCETLGLREGDFVEVRRAQGAVVIKPKKLVDADDVLTPAEEAAVRSGEAQLRRGRYVTLERLRHEMDRQALKRRRKTA